MGKETLINPVNIVKVVYIEHEEYLWLHYRPAKYSKWFKLFDHDEYWKCPWCHDYYTRKEVLKKYPEYTIDVNNKVVRKEPILYIHLSDGKDICVKRNARDVLKNIKELVPELLIINQ